MSIDDHGLEALRKSAEEMVPGQKSETLLRTRLIENLEERTDRINSQNTIYGRAIILGSATSDPVWQIWRVIETGGNTHKTFAQKDGSPHSGFVHVWDDRLSLFPAADFDNPASLLFDGVDEHVTFGDNYTFGPATAFTWSFWMKAQNFSANRCMVSKTTNDASVSGYSFQHTSAGKLFVQFRAPGALYNRTYNTVMTAGVWYHICFTYNGSSNMSGLVAYIDGVAENATAAGNVSAWTVPDDLVVGSRGTTFYFSGNLNQVTVWDKALTQLEVTELYNLGSAIDPANHTAAANLLSYWPFAFDSNFPTEVDQVGLVDGTLVNMEVGDYDTGDVP